MAMIGERPAEVEDRAVLGMRAYFCDPHSP